MSGYGFFAKYYDILTSNIPYLKRGEYFDFLLKKFEIKGNLLLDLACGTGTLSEIMSKLGYDVIAADSSVEMLMQANQKKLQNKSNVTYICQDMTELDLYGGVDGCICALDSINHVTDKNAVQRIFDNVYTFLNDGGLFIFDVNTIYKHNSILSGNTFIYDMDNVFCAWQNSDCIDNTVEMTLDIFAENEDGSYDRGFETFCERAYSDSEITNFIEKAGLTKLACYEADSENNPKEDTQRLVYVTRATKCKGRK